MGLRKAGVLAAASVSLVVGTLAFPGAAMAAKSVDVSGTIALASSATERVTGQLSYGGTAEFATSVVGRLAPKSVVYVSVICWQDSTVVYQWSADPSFGFPLTDQTGQNLEWDGSAAFCTADLIYRPDFNKSSKQVLDTTSFNVSGV